MANRRGSVGVAIGGLLAFIVATILVYSLDPVLQDAIRNAASQSVGPTASLFWLLYYIHGFSVFIELIGLSGLIGAAKH